MNNSKFGTKTLEIPPPETEVCGTKLINSDGYILNKCTKEVNHTGPCRLSLFPIKAEANKCTTHGTLGCVLNRIHGDCFDSSGKLITKESTNV